jgi:RHS repeat-associated protein
MVRKFGVFALCALLVVAGVRAAVSNPSSPKSPPSKTVVALAGTCSYSMQFGSPTNGATYIGPTDIVLSVTAGSNVDGCVATSVKFYNGSTLLAQVANDGSDTFGYTWRNVPLGSYVVMAETPSGSQTSVSFTVGPPNQSPTVSMASPSGAPFIAPAAIGLSASASDSDGSIAKVDFYQGGALIGSDTSAPYTASFTATSAGTYSFSARAYDNGSASTLSAPVSINVAANQLPSASFTSPASNSTFITPATIPIAVNASDSDGAIVRVDFSADGWSASDASAPYTASWATGNIGGIHYINATAVDNKGGTKTVSVSVSLNTPSGSISATPNPCVLYSSPTCTSTVNWSSNDPAAEIWEYYNFWGQTAEGLELVERNTKVGGGTSGSLQVQAGEPRLGLRYDLKSNGSIIASTAVNTNWAPYVSITAPAEAQVFTYPSAIAMTASATDSDGTVTKVEFYNGTTKLGEDSTAPFSLTWNGAVAGTYSLTAKAYDNYSAARVSSPITVVVNMLPTVSLTAPAAGTVNAPTDLVFAANASDSDGSISKVEFYNGTTKLGEDVTAPYSFTWINVSPGTYSLTAKAIDNRNAVATSAAVAVTVNVLPTVSLTAPTNGTVVNAPATFMLTAQAADSDGSISRVEFYDGATKLGEDTVAPYTFTWTNIGTGSHTLTAKAIDNRSATVVSSAATFTVNELPTIRISAPVSGAVVVAPADVSVEAEASDVDDGVAIVEFYVDGTHVATDLVTPFTLQASNLPAGTHTLKAKAYDNRGGATWSEESILIVNERPQVALVSPAPDVGLIVPATINLAATASDPDGTIARVEFYSGATLLGSDTVAPYELSWTVSANGDHSITAHAIDNRGTVTVSTAAILRGRGTSFDLIRDGLITSLFGELPAHDPTVGRVAGEASVSGGAATYTIPIVVPPGRRGMQPQLALTYSSRGGNGVAGMGWSLSGLSSISRCPSTLDQDGVIRPVELGAADKLCLDGQRLIATAGVYGQAGTTYATEIESFSRITQLGGALNSAATYFKVETKSGDVVYYGNNSSAASEARVVPGGVSLPMTWLIERRQDRIGNFVRYSYANYGYGEAVLSSVLYTGYGSTDGDRQIQFQYELRPSGSGANDQASTYVAGGLTRQTVRLKTILTRVGAESVRAYVLAYQTSAATGRSLLASVADCGYGTSGAVCKSPTTFAWQSAPVVHRFSRLNISPAAGLPNMKWEFTTSAGGGDFNGDGTRDVFGVGIDPANPGVRQGYLLALSPDRQITSAIQIDPDSPLKVYGQNGDFDLDGRTDIITHDASNNILIWFWHGPVNSTSTAQALTDVWDTGINNPQRVLEYVGDMDGDGRPDLVLSRPAASPSDSCRYVVEAYLNKPGASASSSANFSKHNQTFCLRSYPDPYTPGLFHTESIEKVDDINGDGLAEIFVHRPAVTNSSWPHERFYYGCRGGSLCGADYTLLETPLSASYPSNDPRAGYVEGINQFGVPKLDINGDGLVDGITGCPELTAPDKVGGVRLNTGLGFGPCGLIRGVPWDLPPRGIGAGRGGVTDINGDGRSEELFPRAYASRVCQLYVPACPPSQSEMPACQVRHLCPEDFSTGDISPSGTADFGDGQERVGGLYTSGYGQLDSSSYFLKARRYIETAPGEFRAEEFDTPLVSGLRTSMGEDMFGDGLADGTTGVNCMFSDPGQCAMPVADSAGNSLAAAYPRNLPDGSPALSSGIFLNENLGPGGIMEPDGLTPQTPDMMSGVRDGLGVQTIWTYYPLSSKAGRGAGDTPLYTIPSDSTARYIDDRHFYFTSSMQVVSDMIQSDGVGDYRSWRYGYGEAMYNARGRGFQGFRTIIEEDEANGIRTTTTFHQKYPLTSQPEEIVVNPTARTGTTGAIKRERYTWRCNRSNRADTAACAAVPAGSVVFPYLDTKESWTYDAATAVSGGEALIGYVQEVNADDASCTGSYSGVSGFDAFGNLSTRTVHVRDVSSGSNGFRAFLSDQCQREQTTFAVDASNWWLDRVTEKQVTVGVTWSGEHPLPSGTSNPVQLVTRRYTWNADRTLDSEILQPGVPYQEKLTQYTYPTTGNYGLPQAVSVTASGDPNGMRTTITTYSPDGYFPIAVRNAINQMAWTSVRLRDGQPVSTTDANGLRALIEYDAFGLAIHTQYRGKTDQEYVAPDKYVAVAGCGTSGCGTAFAAYQVMTVQDGSPTTLARFDALGRPRLKAERQMDGQWTNVYTEYNNRGLTSRQSEPVRSGDSAYWTQFTHYDLLGRLTRKISPQQGEDSRGDRVTTYAYSGRQTAIQVCGSADSGTGNCLNLSRTTDSLGRYVETRDANSGRTRFWYDASGNTLALEDANGVVTRAAYNAIGQRSSVNDPNQGLWNFSYDALGELLSQTDARSITTSFAYDVLGRPKQRSATVDVTGDNVADNVIDRWTYDPVNALGAEASNERTINGAVERTTTTAYDALARPVQADIVQALASGTASYRLRTRYDSYYGRPVGREYPNGEAVEFVYSAYGHAVQEREPATGAVYRNLDGTNARGQPTLETFGGNIQTRPSYAPTTGQLTELLQQANGIEVRRLGYGYDLYGNLIRQTLNSAQSEETYRYDNLHRLVESTRIGAATGTVTYGYDAVGNFTHKSDFSLVQPTAYAYSGGTCGGGPNAVKSVLTASGTRTYCYDANGNLTSDSNGLSLKYDHANLPVIAQRGAARDDFRYGPDNQRTRSWGSDGARIYLPGYEHRTDTGETKVYVGDYAVITRQGGTRKVEYLLKDRLGSVDAVANASGTLTETRGYDPFGKPRSGTWADLSPARLQSLAATPKGFTQHEHLNQIELIHMNGRVFDYNLGRFTGVDPVIQAPLNSQSLNPYSYILNNPLAGTDPTGYRSICDIGRQQNAADCSTYENMPPETTSHGGRLKSGARNNNGATGAGNLREKKAAANDKGAAGSGDTNANVPVTGSDVSSTTAPVVVHGDASSVPTWNQIRQWTIDSSREVARLFSYPGETLESFNLWRHLKTQELTRQFGYEVASAASFRMYFNEGLGIEGQWGAIFSSSSSAFSSAATNHLEGDGWTYMSDQDMHSHGIVGSNYKLNGLEAAYLRWNFSNTMYTAGMKVNSISDHVKVQPNLRKFSPADEASKVPLWLSGPVDMVRGGPGAWPK